MMKSSLPRRPGGILLVHRAQVLHWRELPEGLRGFARGCVHGGPPDAGSEDHIAHGHHTAPAPRPHHSGRELRPPIRRHRAAPLRGQGDVAVSAGHRSGRRPGRRSPQMSTLSGHLLAEKSVQPGRWRVKIQFWSRQH